MPEETAPETKPETAHAEDASPPPASSAKAKPKRKAKRVSISIPPVAKLAGVVAASVALGGAGGSMIVGPRIVAARAAHPAKVEKTDEKLPEAAVEAGETNQIRGPVFQLDNIIVNPAGSQGTRFLMVTVAFELPDQKADALLRENEVRVRDAVLSTLENETLESLVRPGARDSLKQKLSDAVAPLAGHPKWVRTYLPQFLVQ